jgi:hypothetical protein
MARVGSPTIKKLIVADIRRPTLLSDCVIALLCESVSAAQLVHARILERWDEYEGQFVGTGARHVTVVRLVRFLSRQAIVALEE